MVLPVFLSFAMAVAWTSAQVENEPGLMAAILVAEATGRVVLSPNEHGFEWVEVRLKRVGQAASLHFRKSGPVDPFVSCNGHLRRLNAISDSCLQHLNRNLTLVCGCVAGPELRQLLRRLGTPRKSFVVPQVMSHSLGLEHLCRGHRLICISSML